jgi:hypothetical protein
MCITRQFHLRIRIASVCVALSLSGCLQPAVEYQPDSSGRYHGQFRLTTEEADWKRLVERRIQAEIHGEPPEILGETWPQFWRNWYADLRRTEDGEERIAYIRAKRKEHGLNPY